MQLEQIIKLVKVNKNCFGFIKADKLIQDIQENLKCYELVVTVMRTTNQEIKLDNIINKIVLPVCKAKQVLARYTNGEVHVFTRKITKLHIINQIFEKVNQGIGEQEGFKILSNYDMLREDIRQKEIN